VARRRKGTSSFSGLRRDYDRLRHKPDFLPLWLQLLRNKINIDSFSLGASAVPFCTECACIDSCTHWFLLVCDLALLVKFPYFFINFPVCFVPLLKLHLAVLTDKSCLTFGDQNTSSQEAPTPSQRHTSEGRAVPCLIATSVIVCLDQTPSPNVTIGSEILSVGIQPSCWNASLVSLLQANVTKHLERLIGVRVISLLPLPQKLSDAVWQVQFEIRPPLPGTNEDPEKRR
jgi:hypothetical protein